MKIQSFTKRKQQKQKISMITCYDAWSAKIINESAIDVILVGDSGSMVMHGFSSTVSATLEMMVAMTQSVSRAATNKFILGDMPFCSYRQSAEKTVAAAAALMQAGAHAIKLEGAIGNLKIISQLVHSGIPVMGHLGLTPQSVNTLGGYKIQGRSASQAETIIAQAHELEKAGCFALVLECVPSDLAKTISEQLNITTIGIGAGPHTDGQVLVLHDMLGMNDDFNPKFVKQYLQGHQLIKNALDNYHQDVSQQHFPCETEHSFQ